MAEEEKQENEEQPEAAADEGDAGDADTALASEGQAEAGSDDVDVADADSAGGDAEAADEPAGEAEEEEELSPKQIRKLERARATGPAKPQRSPEERAAERAELRSRRAAMRRRHRPREREQRRGGEGTPAAERAPGSRKTRLGTVVSDKADKTITVRIEVVRRHPVYEKVVRRSATVRAHDERNEAGEGDTVRVIESRPRSRTKRWRLVEVLEKAR